MKQKLKKTSKSTKKERLYLWEILVPQCLPNGQKISVAKHKQWDRDVSRLSGGLTILHTVKGLWINPETNATSSEGMIPIRIACTYKIMMQVIRLTAQHYEQKAVIAYLISKEVILFKL